MAPVTVTFVTDAPRSTVPLSLPDGGEEQVAPDALVWQSLAVYKRQCSLYKWAYWVTHNVGVSHIQREKRRPGKVTTAWVGATPEGMIGFFGETTVK